MSISSYTSDHTCHAPQGLLQTSTPDSVCSAQFPDLDVMKRDRFELLSAYLDGEVTPEERQLVLTWISTDPSTKCLYHRLLKLRQGFRQDPITPPCDAEVTVARVLRCLNHRFQLASMAGIGVFVLGALSLMSGGLSSSYILWRWAIAPQQESLQVSLDQPVFPIPKAPTATAVTVDATVDATRIQEQSGLPIESEL
jgi:anti-sigma factor RsiW